MKVQISLNLGSRSNAQILVDAEGYVNSMTDNADFAAPDIATQVGNTKTAVTKLRTTINAPTSDNKTDLVNAARDVLDRELTILKSKVEAVANNPSIPDANRLSIVHSAGMSEKTQSHPQKRVFTVSNTDISGTVLLFATGGAKAHEWQYTPDITTLKNRIASVTTTVAHTEISNLVKGTEYAFFHKAIIADEKTDWEGPIYLIIT